MRRVKIGLSLCLLAAASMLAACSSGTSQETTSASAQTETTATADASEAGTEADAANENTASESQGELIIPVTSCVKKLNPLLEGYKEGWIMLGGIFDELYAMDVNETRYYLAESYEMSDDNTELTVKLKDGLTWHDGEAITADDIIFTLDCCADTNNGIGEANLVYVGEEPINYEKVDDLTVKMTLPSPSASYPEIFGRLKVIPEHVYGGDPAIVESEANLTGIGSGPYKVVDFVEDQYLTCEANENYYMGAPAISKVTYRVMSADTQEVAFMNGEVNFIELANAPAVAKYSSDPNYTVVQYPEGRVNYMAFNKFSPTWADPKAKEAVSLALNREEIVQGAYGDGMAVPANSIFSNMTLYYDADCVPMEQDLERAKQLAEESGLSGKTIKLYYNADRVFMKETALIIQQQLKEINVNLDVQPVENSGFFEIVFADGDDYELYLNGYGAVGDPDNIVAGMYDGTWGINLEVSDEVAQLWADGRATSDETERAAIYKELQQKAVEDMSVYTIAYPNYVFATTANLKGTDAIKTTPIFEDYTKLYFED